ncbi:spore germination protein [Fodinisporobacter ferrooxydans]|uniref:Spore germination protein n=1 Tax=Fodinisporobacter ferrooxydans TaxID=2901836 RepID=A0ABY4CP54_9BACL|nr:spore germination protein [Alicyclobacillaceae bacterium MYW30-H2]
MRTFDQISPAQLTSLLMMTIFPTIILMVPSDLLRVNGKDAGWVVIIATLWGVGIGWFSIAVYKKFPSQRITQIFVTVFGRWIGELFCLVYLGALMVILVAVFREFGEMAEWAFAFGDIPIELLMVMGGILSFYLSASGLEVIARTSQILLPGSIGIIAIILISATPWMNWSFLWPPFPEIRKEILISAITPSAFFTEGLIIGIFLPHIQLQDRIFRAIILGMLFNGIILFLITVGLLAFFGGSRGGNIIFPLLHLSKEIRYSTYLSHLQVLMVPFLVSVITIKLSVFLHAASLGCQDMFRLKGYRFIALGLTVFSIVVASVLFDNPIDLRKFIIRYFGHLAAPILLILTLCAYFFAMQFYKRRAKT